MMSPLEIEIVFHYHCHATDYRDGDYSAPAVKEAIDRFIQEDVLTQIEGKFDPPAFRITDRGSAYVEALCTLQIPIKVISWVNPS